MTFASVRAAAQEAAKRGTLTPHQLAALGRLDELLTDDQRREFSELWRAQGSPARPPIDTGSGQLVAPRTSAPHLRLTRTGTMDGRGLVLLKLAYVKAGRVVDHLMVVSGAPRAQEFRTGAASRAGSLEPLPEGLYRIENIAWAGGRDNYSGSWGAGLGPASVPLTYLAPGTTRRSAIEAHYDANHGTSPGTAGCVGLRSIPDLQVLIRWLRDTDPRQLFVDWGLGTCPAVKA
jgi:lysozyme